VLQLILLAAITTAAKKIEQIRYYLTDKNEPRNGNAFRAAVLSGECLLQFVQTANLLQLFDETLYSFFWPNFVELIFAFFQV